MHRLKLQVSYTTVKNTEKEDVKFKSYQAEFSEIGQVQKEETFDQTEKTIEAHEYVYSEDGLLVEELKKPGINQVVHYKYEYDEFGRITRKTRNLADKVLAETTFTLDGLQETEVTTGPSGLMISKIARIFDEDGKLIELIEYQEEGNPLYTQKFSYDLDENLTMAEYFDENNELMELHIRDFDEEGRVVRFEKQNQEGHILQQEYYTYAELGMLTELKKLKERIEYTYNEFGLEEKIDEYTPENELKRSRTFVYNELGLVAEEIITDVQQNSVVSIENEYEFYPIEELQVS
jgi:hypothetical protein